MLRSFIAIAGSAVLSLLATAAHAQPIDVSNESVTCNSILKGSVKFSPPLVAGGTTPTVAKVKGKLGGCFTLGPSVVFPDYKSKFKGELNLTTNECTALGALFSATGTLEVKWKADPKITPNVSTITVNASSLQAGTHSPPWGASFIALGLGNTTFPTGGTTSALSVSGAFTGGSGGANSTVSIIMQEDTSVYVLNCANAKIKKLNFGIGQLTLD